MTEKISGLVQADASADHSSEKVIEAPVSQKKCNHGLTECDYCDAMAAFDDWLAVQPEDVQELSLLEQIDVYANQPSVVQVTSPNEAERDAVSLNQSLSESIRSLTKAGKGE